MSSFDIPILNGICPSWADIVVRASVISNPLVSTGAPLLNMGDIVSLNTGATVEVGEQREGSRVVQRTTGSISNEASWVLYASGHDKLLRGFMALAPRRGNQLLLSLVHFNITAQWTPPGSSKIFEKRLKGCRLLSDTEDSAEGTDAAQIEMNLNPLQICRVIDGQEIVLL